MSIKIKRVITRFLLFLVLFCKYSFSAETEYSCYIVTEKAGVFSHRFITEELQNKYGDKVLFLNIGAWTDRNWIKEHNVKETPAFILFDKNKVEIDRIEECKNIDKLVHFFQKNLKNEKDIFKITELKYFLTENNHIDVYSIDSSLEKYNELTISQKQSLKIFAKDLKKYLKEYKSVEWLEDAINAVDNISNKTSRYNLKRKIASTVKIVPNLKTFYKEISNWNDGTIYPILLGNNMWSVKFIEAFKPEQIIYVQDTQNTSDDTTINDIITTSLYNSALKNKSSKKISIEDVNKFFLEKIKNNPLGIVIIDPVFSTAPAGVALAAAKYQIVYIREKYGEFDKTVTFQEADVIRKDIMNYLDKFNVPYKNYGIDLDGITLAIDLPYRYKALETEAEKGIRVTDDFIDTNDSGFPWGIAGRLIGDESSSIYRAMCSIFLNIDEALFFSKYSTSSSPWKEYTPQKAVDLFKKQMPVREVQAQDATSKRWREETYWGNKANFVFINSAGGAYNWYVSDGQASSLDIVSSIPCNVYIIHSGSASSPLDKTSILGKWFECGAYNYFGSMSEPLLEAFVTPDKIAKYLFDGYPFALATRDIIGGYSYPWRLVFFGDPLWTLSNTTERVHLNKKPKNTNIYEYFDCLYKKEWDKLDSIYKNSENIFKTNNTYNIALLTYSNKEDINKIIDILKKPSFYELWPATSLLCNRLILKKAYSNNSAEKLKLLKLAYKTSKDIFVLEDIFNELAKQNKDEFFKELDAFLKEEKSFINSIVFEKFTNIYIRELKPSLTDIRKFLTDYSESIKAAKETINIISDYTFKCYNNTPDNASAIIEELIKIGGPNEKTNLIKKYLSYLLGINDYTKIKAFIDTNKKLCGSDKDIQYYSILSDSRSTDKKNAIEIIENYLKNNERSDYASVLKDEIKLLNNITPDKLHIELVLHKSSNIVIDGHINETEWNGYSTIQNLCSLSNEKIYLFLTQEKLYIGGIFYLEKELKPLLKYSQRDASLWADESIELFINYNRDYKSIHQIVFNANGYIFDYLAFNRKWDGDIEVKTIIEEDKWTIEASIPIKDLFPAGWTKNNDQREWWNHIFGFNIVRNSPNSNYKSASWTDCKNNNHNAQLYGYIIIK
ncbi:MAG: hypothetical protein AABY84_00560 [Candidatus Firestonebacteria bacterium]